MIEQCVQELQYTIIKPQQLVASSSGKTISSPAALWDILKRPEFSAQDIMHLLGGARKAWPYCENIEVLAKYEGYISTTK